MDDEMARQYYSSMGYQIGSPAIVSQYPTGMPDPATGYVPAGYPTSSQSGRHYQNPYTEAVPAHPASSMHEYHAQHLITSSPPTYPGYLPEAYQQSMTHAHADEQQQLYHHSYHANTLQRTSSASETHDLEEYGIRQQDGTWRCKYPGCTSKSVFTRACDLRKHFNRHTKYLFCRFDGCPQATEGGFSSKKDRARHEAKHNPQIPCEWEDCDRVFSRMDNMKDHVRRIHYRQGR